MVKTKSPTIISFLFKNKVISKLLTILNKADKHKRNASLSLIGILVSYCETNSWHEDDLNNGVIPPTYSGGKNK